MSFEERIRLSLPFEDTGSATGRASSGSPAGGPAELRTWTRTKGATVEAKFVSMHGGLVVLRKPEGGTLKINKRFLSEADQEYLSSR